MVVVVETSSYRLVLIIIIDDVFGRLVQDDGPVSLEGGREAR